MKNLSLRIRLTIWFSAALVLMSVITFMVVIMVNWSVLQKTNRDQLVYVVEDNVDEVEYFETLAQLRSDSDIDIYLRYQDGYLEIDDDFLDAVGGVYTALCSQDGTLLYGENPIYSLTKDLDIQDSTVQHVGDYYVYDCLLAGDGLDGLWLRGVISQRYGIESLSTVVRTSLIVMALLVIFAIVGGILFAGRALRPIRQMNDVVTSVESGEDLKKRIPDGSMDELGQISTASRGMMAGLDSYLQRERRFTSDVSHELRTPVSVILAQCDDALSGECTQEEYHNALMVINRQGRMLSRMTGEMLELLRMENHSDIYSVGEIELSGMVESLSEDMSLIRDKNIALTWDVEPDITIMGDAGLITRLVNNRISNAYRYG